MSQWFALSPHNMKDQGFNFLVRGGLSGLKEKKLNSSQVPEMTILWIFTLTNSVKSQEYIKKNSNKVFRTSNNWILCSKPDISSCYVLHNTAVVQKVYITLNYTNA